MRRAGRKTNQVPKDAGTGPCRPRGTAVMLQHILIGRERQPEIMRDRRADLPDD